MIKVQRHLAGAKRLLEGIIACDTEVEIRKIGSRDVDRLALQTYLGMESGR